MTATKKTCGRCGQEKPADAFSRRGSGLQSNCKSCRHERYIEAQQSESCARCGEPFPVKTRGQRFCSVSCARRSVRDYPREGTCEGCGTPFRRNRRGQRFCSQPCSTRRQRDGSRRVGAGNHQWKGDDAGYQAVHRWRLRNLTKTGACSECGATPGSTEWSNTSGEYRRDESDWRELCIPCHRRFDSQRRTSTARTTQRDG